MRSLNEEEDAWLDDHAVGKSHAVTATQHLVACDDCEWVASADSFEYLMELATTHLAETYAPLNIAQQQMLRREFTQLFGWDPWAEGLVEDVESHVYDLLVVDEKDEDGEIISETHYERDLGDSYIIDEYDYDDEDDEEGDEEYYENEWREGQGE